MPKPPLVECQDCNGQSAVVRENWDKAVIKGGRRYPLYERNWCERCDGTGQVCSRCSEPERWCECPERS